MINLTKQNHVNILTMDSENANAVDFEFLAAMHKALDAIEADGEGHGALVLTGAGKAFSTGLNLPVVSGFSTEQFKQLDTELKKLYGRLVNFPLPTVAAINGHAFAAGAILAMSCDFRVMREDRGWFCMSEVDVGVPIGLEVMAVAKDKLAPSVIRDMILTGKRFSGQDCVASGIAESACSEDNLLNSAIEIAASLAEKERGIFKSLKSTLYSEMAANLGVSS